MKKFFIISLILTKIMNAQIGELDSLLLPYADGDKPGIALAVLHNGERIFERYSGLQNVEEKIPISSATNFRLASVTKAFTAACALRLIEAGKLKFTSTLKELFPEFASIGNVITVEMLLNHTSGLIDYESLMPDTQTVQIHEDEILEMMKKVDSTYFKPGTDYNYSNTGYALLSQIVELLTGKSFIIYLEENIFNPLEMKNSLAFREGINFVPNRAYGYSRVDSINFKRDDQSSTSAVLGDGGIYSSINDMIKWEASFSTDKILPATIRKMATNKTKLTNGTEIDYGFGWYNKIYNNYETIYHTGGTRGFRNILFRVPSENFVIIIFINRDEGDTLWLAQRIFDYYLMKTSLLNK